MPSFARQTQQTQHAGGSGGGTGPSRTEQPRGNAAAQDAMQDAQGGGEGWSEVVLHVPFRDEPVRLKVPIGEDGSIPLNPNTPLGRGVVLNRATLQLDTDGHLKGGSVGVKLTKNLNLGKKAGLGMTLLAGEGKELSADLEGDTLKQAAWSLDAELRNRDGDKVAAVSMKDSTVKFGGPEPLFSGDVDVTSVEAVELLNGAVKVGQGGGAGGTIEDNEPQSFRAEKLTLDFALPGMPDLSGGEVSWLDWKFGRGGGGFSWLDFEFEGKLPDFSLPRFGLPGAHLMGWLNSIGWKGGLPFGKGGGKWKWPNFDLGIEIKGFDFDKIPFPKIGLDLSGLLPKIPFTPNFSLFSRGKDEPWMLFNKILSGTIPLPGRIRAQYEARFAVMAALDVGLRETEVGLTAEMDEYAFDANNPLQLPNIKLGAELPETNVVEANAKGKAIAEGVIPGYDKPAWLGLSGEVEGAADLNAATRASAKLQAGDKIGGKADLGVHLGGGVDVGFDLNVIAACLGYESGDKQLFSLSGMKFASPFSFDHDWEAGFGDIDMADLGKDALVDPKRDPKPVENLQRQFDAGNQQTSTDPKQEVAPSEGAGLAGEIGKFADLIALFGDLVGIFGTVHDILTDWGVDASSPKDMILDIARKKMSQAETLVEKTTSFHDRVTAAQDNGLFDFLEEDFPGGKTIVEILKAYLWAVDVTYKGISKAAGALGGTDYEAQFKAMDQSFYKSNTVWNVKMKEQYAMIARGYDWCTATDITVLEFKSKSEQMDAEAEGRIDPGWGLKKVKADMLRIDAEPKVKGSEGVRAAKRKELVDGGIPEVAATEIAALWRLDYVNVTGVTAFGDAARKWDTEVREAMAPHEGNDEERKSAAERWASSRRAERIGAETGRVRRS